MIRRMRFAYWINKATDRHSEYVIVITLPLQHWLHERVSVLGYTYLVCVVFVDKHTAISISLGLS